jgi:hypothetical protein
MEMKMTLLLPLVALVLLTSSGLAAAAPLPSSQPVTQIASALAPPELQAFLATLTPATPVPTAAAPFGGTAIWCPILPPQCPHPCEHLGCVVCCS